jgi:UDP-N-acetylmuramate: L-alanyl-gamma-D-glutamyl-meso-diaminopimelate ligase
MHIHILGIAGTMTAHLAVNLKKQGHLVTGSDQEKIYPPISTTLKKIDIKVNSTNIDKSIDLAIIGSSYNSFERSQQEFDQIKKLNIPYISATEYIAQNLIKENSILIAGSFGKTTITSLISWIFLKAKKDPNYMFAGNPKNKFDSLHLSLSNWSITEADESIHGLDKMAKFLYYPVKYLVLTSADWEHKDSYSTEIDNFTAFKKLVLKIPESGVLLINDQSSTAKKISLYSNSKVITYNSENSDYFIEKKKIKTNLTTLLIHSPSGLIKIDTQLIGQFNFENILAAVAISDFLGIKTNIIQKAVFSFRGIKRRLEMVANYKNILFFDDFAQSAPRIESTLQALQDHYPNKNIKVFYQAHASFIQYRESLIGLEKAFKPAREVVLGQLKFSKNIDKKDRNSAKDFKNLLGSKLIYLPLEKQIIQYYKDSLMPNDILIYMSSGGLVGNRIFKSIINCFK